MRQGRSSPPEPVGRPGTLLGLLDSVEVHDAATTLEPGDAVVFFTDGVTEARNEHGFFGDERLAALLHTLRGKDAAGMAQGVVESVVEYQHGDPRDDIAVLVVKMPDRLA